MKLPYVCAMWHLHFIHDPTMSVKELLSGNMLSRLSLRILQAQKMKKKSIKTEKAFSSILGCAMNDHSMILLHFAPSDDKLVKFG